jgi:hypothetical protein
MIIGCRGPELYKDPRPRRHAIRRLSDNPAGLKKEHNRAKRLSRLAALQGVVGILRFIQSEPSGVVLLHESKAAQSEEKDSRETNA